MFPPPVKGGPPVGRVLLELAKRAFLVKAQDIFDELSEEPIGFVARALGEEHRRLESEGRSWTNDDVARFCDERLPAVLEQARAHKREREGA